MNERLAEELELIREEFPALEFRKEDLWGRVPGYPVPPEWGSTEVAIAFRAPGDLFGEEPYGFWVSPPLVLPGGGQPSNTSGPVDTAFGPGWQQFSWSFDGCWKPGPTAAVSSNLRDFIRSFARRLAEVN